MYTYKLLLASAHAHIEGPRPRDRKAALAVVELHGRTSGVKEDAVDASGPDVPCGEQGAHVRPATEEGHHLGSAMRENGNNER